MHDAGVGLLYDKHNVMPAYARIQSPGTPLLDSHLRENDARPETLAVSVCNGHLVLCQRAFDSDLLLLYNRDTPHRHGVI